MIQRVFLIVGLLLAVGFAPAVAQDLFIKKHKSAKDGEKPSLFLKPSKSAAGKKQSVVKYGKNKLAASQKAKTLIQIETLTEIQKLGLKPKSAEDILFYADLHRAAAYKPMLEREARVAKYARAEELKVQRRFEQQQAEIVAEQEAALELAFGNGGAVSSVPKEESVKKKFKKNSKLFLSTPANKAKPTKVFTNFR